MSSKCLEIQFLMQFPAKVPPLSWTFFKSKAKLYVVISHTHLRITNSFLNITPLVIRRQMAFYIGADTETALEQTQKTRELEPPHLKLLERLMFLGFVIRVSGQKAENPGQMLETFPALQMNLVRILVWVSLLDLLFLQVQAQTSYGQDSLSPSSQDRVSSFQPSLAVVIGILTVMFFVTFVLLVYAKFCHRAGPTTASSGDRENPRALMRSRSRLSGIDKTVIESLPFFRFSSLKGSKEGLECAVCLSKFEDIEILRLLPKCRHAFHIDCIDYWLEKHSSCPLCRSKVSAEDPASFTYSNSMRLMSQSDMRQDSNYELFVQREAGIQGSSSRFSIGSSFRKIFKSKKEEEILEEAEHRKILHKLNHRIIASDAVLKNRWSNVSSSDLMFLNSEMLNELSSNRFSSLEPEGAGQATTVAARTFESGEILKIKEEMDRKRLFESKLSSIDKNSLVSVPGQPSTSPVDAGTGQRSKFMSPADKRSMSEMTGVSRFGDSSTRNRNREMSLLEGGDFKDERMRQIWLPIARRTVRWFANRERRSQDTQSPAHTTVPDV